MGTKSGAMCDGWNGLANVGAFVAKLLDGATGVCASMVVASIGGLEGAVSTKKGKSKT
jgi:hypothetical protein